MSNKTYNEIVSRINNATEEIKATVKSKNAEINGLQRDLEIVKRREHELKNSFNGQVQQIERLQKNNDACRAMRQDLEKKLDARNAELKKQGDELTVKSDELKKLNSKLIETTNERNIAKANLEECKGKMQLAYDNGQANHKSTAALIEGINAAMAEMRKVNRGKPSHNKSRAFQHLEKAMAVYNAAQPKTNEA